MQSSVADDRLRAAAETGHTPNAHGGLSTHHTPPVTRTNEKKPKNIFTNYSPCYGREGALAMPMRPSRVCRGFTTAKAWSWDGRACSRADTGSSWPRGPPGASPPGGKLPTSLESDSERPHATVALSLLLSRSVDFKKPA
jgi:hypothetical protein